MLPNDFQESFVLAVNEVLETMFFTSIEDESCEPGNAEISAELHFLGKVNGTFGIQVSEQTGAAIAANFLGTEDPTPQQVEEVVCELCNMLCGSVLSRLDVHARFVLLAPALDPQNTDLSTRDQVIGRTMGIAEGPVTVWMQLDASAGIRSAA